MKLKTVGVGSVFLDGMVGSPNLLAQFSDDMLRGSIDRLKANTERPGAAEALQFALAEQDRRGIKQPSRAPAKRALAAANSSVAPQNHTKETSMEKNPVEIAEQLASKARTLMAQAKAHGTTLQSHEAVRLAKLPDDHVEVVAFNARNLQKQFADHGEELDAADAVRMARSGRR